MLNNDLHHCHCFFISEDFHKTFKTKLEGIGFKDPFLQENHDQFFGLTKRLDEYTQIHVKLLKNNCIESEMEYPPDYPFAHINEEHSYSAHYEIKEILDSMTIPYSYQTNPPTSCLRRKIIKALNPSHAGAIALGLLAGIVIVGLLSYFMKDEKE